MYFQSCIEAEDLIFSFQVVIQTSPTLSGTIHHGKKKCVGGVCKENLVLKPLCLEYGSPREYQLYRLEWLSFCSPRYSPRLLVRWKFGGCWMLGSGTASWPFQLGTARCMVNQPCGPGKVRRVTMDQCACPAEWLLWSVLSIRGEVAQAGLALFRGFLEKHTSKYKALWTMPCLLSTGSFFLFCDFRGVKVYY